jgi:mono/diheme cytochrome c family protein
MSDETIIRTAQGDLVDRVYTSPVDRWQHRFRRIVLLAVIFFALVVALALLRYFLADQTVAYKDIREHFKYGSIGSEPGGSLLTPVGGVLPPYLIFKALPAICPEKLPGGYASLGLIFEPSRDLPVGISRRRRLGLDQVGVNCAACHTGTVRTSAESAPEIVLGMPAHQFDLERFFQFVQACTLDDRMTAGNVIQKAEQGGTHVSLMQKLLLHLFVIDRIKLETLSLRNRIGPLLDDPTLPQWGRGRVDTFNPYKAIQFNWDLTQLPRNELMGAADFPSLWNQGPREGMHLHWDGNNTSLDERNLSAALGAGVTPVTVDYASIQRVHDWILTLPPPRFPFRIDAARSARGKAIFDAQCAECHSFTGGRTGSVEDISSVGTDPYRLNSYTYVLATSQALLFPDNVHRFEHFSKTNGYANVPLDGVWARAPYLHNGSVPSLADLLNPPADRPRLFARGYDVYDEHKVGFVSDTPEARAQGSVYDTTIPGNGNGGHLYGTNLGGEQKLDLLEYLKTL